MTSRRARLAFALCAALLAAPAPAWAQGQPDVYRQHMENGIKLFQDRNYRAAIAEFEAAYKQRPKASPLFNIALAEKALFNYPRAIAALERALSQHRDTMDEADEKTARSAIEEMRALLARVTVELSPQAAILSVDGDDQPPSNDASRTIDLGPGVHRIGARADGYASAEQSVNVVSGERDKAVRLALAPDKGSLVIDADDPETAIAVDSRFVAYGAWTGMLVPGTHLVQIYTPSRVVYAAQVVVVAGKAQEVRPGYGGVPIVAMGAGSPQTTPPPPPPPPKSAPAGPPRRGYFVLGAASLLLPITHPKGFTALTPDPNSGGAGALRVGYRVNNAASFDVMLQYGNVETSSKDVESASYTLSTGRLGLNLRLMTPGQRVRFVGSLGAGLAYDDVTFEGTDTAEAQQACAGLCVDASGVDPFLFTDLGIELDFSSVLVGFSFESFFQSSRGIEDPGGREIYSPSPLMYFGGGIRVGYAFW